jgi:hypothetical protein
MAEACLNRVKAGWTSRDTWEVVEEHKKGKVKGEMRATFILREK